MSGESVRQQATRQLKAIFSAPRNGYLGEAIVFAYLQQSPVVRAPEFSPVDGAIYTGWQPGAIPSLFSARIREVQDDASPCCINFDVKNRRLLERMPRKRPRSLYWRAIGPSAIQRDHCSFIIIIFNALAGPSRDWVAVVPIGLFSGLLGHSQQAYNNVFLWTTVDPALYPYTMPIEYLPAAINHLLELSAEPGPPVYKNPWSGISLSGLDLRRRTSTAVTRGTGTATPQARVSKEHLDWIQGEIERYGRGFAYEINDIQPLQGDFLLGCPDGRWLLVEHKANQFSEQGGSVTFQLWEERARNPFHPLRLWDLIFWHNRARGIAYCIPRACVPDSFCVEKGDRLRVAVAELSRWRVELDDAGRWLPHIYNAIVVPFCTPPSPKKELLPSTLRDLPIDIASAAEDEGAEDVIDEPDLVQDPGRAVVRSLRSYGLQGFMEILQRYCALAKRGLVLPLWRHSPLADYVFLDWSWTEAEQRSFLSTGELPFDIVDRRIRPQATLCLFLKTAVFYSTEKGGSLKTPRLAHSLINAEDPHLDYFLAQEQPFVVIGDPAPHALSCGGSNVDHPYLMIASEHLRRPGVEQFNRPQSLRLWLRDCRDPYRFCQPVRAIQQSLVRMARTDLQHCQYSRNAPAVETAPYRHTVFEAWQAHADAAAIDAQAAQRLRNGRLRYTHLISSAEA